MSYKVMVREGENVPVAKLKSTFEAINGTVQDERPWILTSRGQDSWASVHLHPLSLNFLS